jgi:hypothetical protein
MNIFLIVINIFLIVFVVILLPFLKNNKGNTKNNPDDNMNGIELLEFQQNLKEMIEDFKNFSDDILKKIDDKEKELNKILNEADIKIKEIKYLIERVNLLREAEYKVELKKDVPIDEKNKKPTTEKVKKPISKFVIDEKSNEDIKVPDKYEKIKNLLQSGMSIAEIAKITGLSKGEIELVKNLKKDSQ